MGLFVIDKKDDWVIHRMLEIIDSSNAIEQCKAVAKEYDQKAIEAVDKIRCLFDKGNFKALIKFVIDRKN
jgi:geranylgeranyl pyrophosphate synthase